MSESAATPTVETRVRLLDAAERLFAEEGIASTSLRSITSLADANLAAVHYHFGSKEALLEAIFGRLMQPLNARRLQLLDEAEALAGGRPVELEAALDAFIRPMVEMMTSSRGILHRRLFVRLLTETDDELRARILSGFRPFLKRFFAVLRRTCPELDASELGHRIRFLLGSVVYSMMDVPVFTALGEPEPEATPSTDTIRKRLVRFAVAGFKADPA